MKDELFNILGKNELLKVWRLKKKKKSLIKFRDQNSIKKKKKKRRRRIRRGREELLAWLFFLMSESWTSCTYLESSVVFNSIRCLIGMWNFTLCELDYYFGIW